jgi:hypothetical protein
MGMFPLSSQLPIFRPSDNAPNAKTTVIISKWNEPFWDAHIIEAKKHNAPKFDGAVHQLCHPYFDLNLPANRNPNTDAKIQVMLKHHFLYTCQVMNLYLCV